MQNLSPEQVKHLIEVHEEILATLKTQIADRPMEPEGINGFPPVVSFYRPMNGLTVDDPVVNTPFVAIRYSTGCWFLNRGAGATSQALSWDALLDWIKADNWPTIRTMGAVNPLPPKLCICESASGNVRPDCKIHGSAQYGCSNDAHHKNCKCGA